MAAADIIILRPQDYRQMQWRNGKGVTVEIAAYPQGASIDDFDWRVSMAKVSEDGPFSSFPGIDRTLSILDGNGLELVVEGAAPANLTIDTPPHAFAADRPTYARLLDGALTDFNVMTRRGHCAHAVEMITTGRRLLSRKDWNILLAYCHAGAADIETDGRSAPLKAGQTAIIDSLQTAAITFNLTSGTRIYLAKISSP